MQVDNPIQKRPPQGGDRLDDLDVLVVVSPTLGKNRIACSYFYDLKIFNLANKWLTISCLCVIGGTNTWIASMEVELAMVKAILVVRNAKVASL